MLGNTRLAAVYFTHQDTRFIRVYFQHENCIEEVCFDPKNGWHTKKDRVVAATAKDGSPIAAVVRDNGNETRVYFLDGMDQINERVRRSSSPDKPGEWKDDPKFEKKKVPSTSQLAAAFSGKSKENIHIFYQASNDTVQELKYDDDEGWDSVCVFSEDAGPAPEVQKGSSLFVVSTGDSDLRLFYQLQNGKIQEQYTNSERDWTENNPGPFDLPAKASISAVAWDLDGFEIRLYSVSTNNELLEMTYTKKKWLKGPVNTGKITSTRVPRSAPPVAVAAVRMPYDQTVRVFYPYQPGHIGESIILENRVLHFSTESGTQDNSLQAEVTPLVVYLPRDGHRKRCEDKQAQESGIWPSGSGLAADIAKQNQLVEELRGKVKKLEDQVAALEASRLVGGSDVRQWKSQYEDMYSQKLRSDSNYDGMNSRYTQLSNMVWNARSSAVSSAKAVDSPWGQNTTAGYLASGNRRWTVSAILGAAMMDASFDSSETWTGSYRSLP